jgi:dihydrofolate synthase/folylpolyglutamate synthase
VDGFGARAAEMRDEPAAPMNYDEAVRYLLALGHELAAPRQPAATATVAKIGLRNISLLADRLGNPHRAVPCAHIAGTNGKGSTAAMLESILRAAGLRTGLYISPHLVRINERIRLDGSEISDLKFETAFTRVQAFIEAMLASGTLSAHPTYFECLTAMAFDCFAGGSQALRDRSKTAAASISRATSDADSSARREAPGLGMTDENRAVDFAVYETGMGGRLDATNIVAPEVAVITQIDFDHENYLGHSIEQIAAEKAGIIKPGSLVVSAAERLEARAVIAQRCEEVNAQLVEVDAAYRSKIETGSHRIAVSAKNSSWRLDFALPLEGRYQVRNALAAIAAARLLAERGFAVDDAAIVRGLESVRWPGRLERVAGRPDVYLDGTHNPAGARELVAFWEERFAGRKIHLVYGAMRDKAVDEITGLLFPRAATVIVTAPRQPRAISAAALAAMAQHLAERVEIVSDPGAALERAIELAAPEDAVFATGSLYLAGDLLRYWSERPSKLALPAGRARM